MVLSTTYCAVWKVDVQLIQFSETNCAKLRSKEIVCRVCEICSTVTLSIWVSHRKDDVYFAILFVEEWKPSYLISVLQTLSTEAWTKSADMLRTCERSAIPLSYDNTHFKCPNKPTENVIPNKRTIDVSSFLWKTLLESFCMKNIINCGSHP